MIKTTSNPYTQQVIDQGRDPSNAPAKGRQFPCTIHGRRFETKEQYDEAIADFLNGM